MREKASALARAVLLAAVAGGALPSAGQTTGAPQREPGIDGVLARVAERVEQYFARAQSLVCDETVHIQHVERSFSAAGQFGRHLLYELRVAWEPAFDGKAPDASVQRQLLKVNGRAPKPHDTDACFDPKAVSPEPLAMFLRRNQADYVFTASGDRKVSGRAALMIDYKPRVAPGTPEITWPENCVHVELPHWEHGRVWVDPATGDILRLDETISRRFEFRVPREQQKPFGPTFMVIERADTSIRYKTVAFHDPEESVLLPESIDTLQVFQEATRISQTFTNYRRFMTGGRLVKDP